MTTQSERLARFMFDRQADTYEADPGLRELAWLDPDISGFWVAEAEAVMAELGITGHPEPLLDLRRPSDDDARALRPRRPLAAWE